ncbi:MAG: hypothetical protein ACOC1O_03830 [bacterium]
MKSKLLLISIIFLSLNILVGCSSENNGSNNIDETINISGQVINDTNVSSNSISSQNNDINADNIWAFPLKYDNTGEIDINFIEEKEEFTINKDGTFSIDVNDLNESDQYIFVLVDDQASLEEKFVGFLAVKGGEDNLNSILINDLNSAIDLGEVNKENNEFISDKSIIDISENFTTLSNSDLRELSIADNLIKTIKNYYINYYFGDYKFMGYSYYAAHLGPIESNQFTKKFNIDDSNINYYFKTSNGPSDIMGYELSAPDNTTYDILPDGNQQYMTSKSASEKLPRTSPSGFWNLYDEKNDKIGKYDFSINNPVDKEGYLIGYIPTFKLNVNNDGKVETVTLKWYLNNGNGHFEEVNNLNLIPTFVKRAFFQFNGGDSNNGGNWNVYDLSEKEIEVPEEYDIHIDDLFRMNFNYSVIGTKFELVYGEMW